MMINDEVVRNPNLFFCSTPDCGYLDVNKAEVGTSRVDCRKCAKGYCTMCKGPWHGDHGKVCAEVRVEEDARALCE